MKNIVIALLALALVVGIGVSTLATTNTHVHHEGCSHARLATDPMELVWIDREIVKSMAPNDPTCILTPWAKQTGNFKLVQCVGSECDVNGEPQPLCRLFGHNWKTISDMDGPYARICTVCGKIEWFA